MVARVKRRFTLCLASAEPLKNDYPHYQSEEPGSNPAIHRQFLFKVIMTTLSLIITNSGDGSNGLQWVTDEKVIDAMEQLVDDGSERYTSGDGLQVRDLKFPKGFNIDAWLKLNKIRLTTISDL